MRVVDGNAPRTMFAARIAIRFERFPPRLGGYGLVLL